jgi:hypothetical protein
MCQRRLNLDRWLREPESKEWKGKVHLREGDLAVGVLPAAGAQESSSQAQCDSQSQ